MYVKKVWLVGFAANAAGKQKNISLLPGDLLGLEFMTITCNRHDVKLWMEICTWLCKRPPIILI
jgi:hypothetical protein